MPSQVGIPLILYLTMINTAMKVVLDQKIEREERAIYYIYKSVPRIRDWLHSPGEKLP